MLDVEASTLKMPPCTALLILYSVITDPPLEAPSFQVSPKVVAVLYYVSSTKAVGALGAAIIVAPLPIGDSIESPFTFVAITLTRTLTVIAKENGGLVNTDRGIVH